MDEKETSLSTVNGANGDKRMRWKGQHTFAAALMTVCALVFTYAAATAASTVERDTSDSILPSQIVTVADVSYVVSEDGELFAQGLNNTGQLGIGSLVNSENWVKVTFPEVEQQPKIEKVSSYGEHAIALDSTGALWTWGDAQTAALGSVRTNPAVSPTRLNVSYSLDKLAAGDNFALALDDRGKLHVWGQNESGQLGTGDTEPREGPTLIMEDNSFDSVAAGSNFAFAIDNNGALWAWGANDSGQFGNNSKKSSSIPVLVSEGPWKGVYPSRFSDTVAAISRDGILHTWGPGANALIGNGRDWRAEQVAENKRVEDEKARIRAEDEARRTELVEHYQAEAFAQLMEAWRADHAEWVTARDQWNAANPEPQRDDFVIPEQPDPSNPEPEDPEQRRERERESQQREQEQLREYEEALAEWNEARDQWLSENPEPAEPTQLPQQTIDEIEARVTEEFEYTDTSHMVPRVIEEPEIGKESLTPVAIATGTRFKKVAIGSENAFALDEQGHLWSWGTDENGQTGLGLDESTHTHTPVKAGDASFNDVFAGPGWAVAVSGDGVFTWGTNDSMNRLLSDKETLASPTLVKREGFSRVTGTTSTALASRDDGSSVSWGENIDGIAGQNSESQLVDFAPIEGRFRTAAFAADGALALAQDSGHIHFWGSDRERISSGRAIAEHVLTPTRQVISRFLDVAAGRLSTHVLDANGFVWTWGQSWTGDISSELDVIETPTRLPLNTKISKIAAAQTNVMLVSDSNRIFWWGSRSPDFKVTEVTTPDDFGSISQLVAGKSHFLLRDEEGKVWSFSAHYGAANISGLDIQILIPVKLPGSASFIAAGWDSSAAIVQGVAYGWGDNLHGQLIPNGESYYPEPTEMSPPLFGHWSELAISKTHALASTETGVLYGWGFSPYIAGFGIPVEAPVHVKIPNER